MYQVQVQKSLLEIMVLSEPHCVFIKLGRYGADTRPAMDGNGTRSGAGYRS
jgi:hypothetical protein